MTQWPLTDALASAESEDRAAGDNGLPRLNTLIAEVASSGQIAALGDELDLIERKCHQGAVTDQVLLDAADNYKATLFAASRQHAEGLRPYSMAALTEARGRLAEAQAHAAKFSWLNQVALPPWSEREAIEAECAVAHVKLEIQAIALNACTRLAVVERAVRELSLVKEAMSP